MLLADAKSEVLKDADKCSEPELATSNDESDDVDSPGDDAGYETSDHESVDALDTFSLVSSSHGWVVHVFTGVAHYQPDESSDRLACGRQITTNLRVIERDELESAGAVFCRQCESVHKKESWDTISQLR